MHTCSATSAGRTPALAASLVALALLVGAPRAVAAQASPAEQSNISLVNAFCEAFATKDLSRLLPFLADDVSYRVTETAPPVIGPAAVVARLKPIVDSSTSVEFKVVDTYAKGPMVINHRIDTFASERPFVWEGVGVFFVKDGKIKEWHDYTIRTSGAPPRRNPQP